MKRPSQIPLTSLSIIKVIPVFVPLTEDYITYMEKLSLLSIVENVSHYGEDGITRFSSNNPAMFFKLLETCPYRNQCVVCMAVTVVKVKVKMLLILRAAGL